MFNRSSKNAAQTPLESTFPLRRHYNNQHKMLKQDKMVFQPDKMGQNFITMSKEL